MLTIYGMKEKKMVLIQITHVYVCLFVIVCVCVFCVDKSHAVIGQNDLYPISFLFSFLPLPPPSFTWPES